VMSVDGFLWSPDRVDFSSNQIFEEREVDIEQDQKEREHVPQILILSSGELTPFKVEFRLDSKADLFLSQQQQGYRVNLSADTLGMVNVVVAANE